MAEEYNEVSHIMFSFDKLYKTTPPPTSAKIQRDLKTCKYMTKLIIQ